MVKENIALGPVCIHYLLIVSWLIPYISISFRPYLDAHHSYLDARHS
jgi:hypothetical protein